MKLLAAILVIQRIIHVLFVIPTGETLTNAEQARGLAAVADAAVFWSTHSPIPADLQVRSTVVITTGDPYASLEWSRPYLHNANPDVTIFVIDNGASGRLLLGHSVGQAQDYYGAIWVVTQGYPGDDGLAAALAHELGHVLYGLNDLPPGPTDIMRMPPTAAYRAGWIGCDSLERLGAPCTRFYVPLL